MEEVLYILNVKNVPQKGTSLCWAAAMQMVIHYLDPGSLVYQGNLSSKQFYLWSFDRISLAEMANCDFGRFSSIEDFYCETHFERWNKDLVNEKNTQPFDTIYSMVDYYSVHEEKIAGSDYSTASRYDNTQLLTWDLVKYQIEDCHRPFIIVLGEFDEDGNSVYSATHAVVVTGFWIDTNCHRYLYVNDPLSEHDIMEGKSYFIDFDNLVSGQNLLKIKSITLNIKRKRNLELRSGGSKLHVPPPLDSRSIVDSLPALGVVERIARANRV